MLHRCYKANPCGKNPTQIKGFLRWRPIHHWTARDGEFVRGKVHAKIVVSDEKFAFLTSANLTGHAMERNIEAGALFRGGDTPRNLAHHLRGLIDLKILTRFDG